MSHLLVQAVFQTDSGLAEDKVVNTFHFRGLGDFVNPAMIAPTLAKVRDFYTTAGTGSTAAPMTHMASTLSPTGHVVKCYDQAQPIPRAPVGELAFTITPASTAVPSEIALCLSFRGALVSGQIPARRRGRIYFGPLAKDNEVTTGSSTIPATNVMNDLLNAAKKLEAANVDPAPAEATGSIWVVAGASGLVDVVHAWVDNAWDVQRRRGRAPSARVSADL